eukprot:scaffold511846_cov15-Prasinocladus_malaysianus.AAC.1
MKAYHNSVVGCRQPDQLRPVRGGDSLLPVPRALQRPAIQPQERRLPVILHRHPAAIVNDESAPHNGGMWNDGYTPIVFGAKHTVSNQELKS